MQHRHGAAFGAATAAALTVALVAPIGSASADPQGSRPAQSQVTSPGSDHRVIGSDIYTSKPRPTAQLRKAMRAGARADETPVDAKVGDTAKWPALDDSEGDYLKQYTLRGIGDHIEVWVADDTTFPAGDCRNDLGMTDVTDAQVSGFVQEFDSNIYPKESASFSVAPDQDGSERVVPSVGPGTVSADQADNIVTLIDNVRDANYYAPSTPDGQTFIAGFFSPAYNAYAGRNVMTIDANDWLHRTGATPPDDSEDPAYVACAKSQGSSRGYGASRPRDYEGTFAHEYQHLLESYVDADEVSWVNEGLSDYAQTLVGYVDTTLPPTAPDADGHIGCFQGYLPESFGGAENSLTAWGDQGDPEILCDYGAAYSFMMYLSSHYGEKFMSALHTQSRNGFDGLNHTLAQFKADKTAKRTLHDWLVTMATDAALDDSGKLTGGKVKDFTASQLNSTINWGNPQSYDSLGAPVNGADFVRLGNSTHWLKGSQISSLRFKGASSLAPDPVEWTVDTAAPDTTEGLTCGETAVGTASTALYSGCGDNFDRSIVHQVTVPKSGATLSFQALWDTEEAWDFGFVQVSTNGGKTYKSLATEDTTTEHDPGALGSIVDAMPGFTGASGGWKTETADLSAYAGKKVLLAFRYMTDPNTGGAGFWVKDVTVGSTTVPTGSLEGWKTMTQILPQAVPGWTVQLIGITKNNAVHYANLKIDDSFRGRLVGKDLWKAVGRNSTTVAALVTMDDMGETLTKYGTYRLTAQAPGHYGHRAGR